GGINPRFTAGLGPPSILPPARRRAPTPDGGRPRPGTPGGDEDVPTDRLRGGGGRGPGAGRPGGGGRRREGPPRHAPGEGQGRGQGEVPEGGDRVRRAGRAGRHEGVRVGAEAGR